MPFLVMATTVGSTSVAGPLIGGFITPEAAYRRSRLRKKFYESPDPATVTAILTQEVRWIVADQDHPAPPEIQFQWRLAFQAGSVRIYSKGA